MAKKAGKNAKYKNGAEIKIEGDVLTVTGMRSLLQDLKSVCGLDWRKECGVILAAELEATFNQGPSHVDSNGEAVYYNKLR